MEGTPPNRYEFEDGSFVEVAITQVPATELHPSGIKYRFQYVDRDGTPRLRYDNAHGRHERHVGPGAPRQPVEYPGDVPEHLRRFFAEVDHLRED